MPAEPVDPVGDDGEDEPVGFVEFVTRDDQLKFKGKKKASRGSKGKKGQNKNAKKQKKQKKQVKAMKSTRSIRKKHMLSGGSAPGPAKRGKTSHAEAKVSKSEDAVKPTRRSRAKTETTAEAPKAMKAPKAKSAPKTPKAMKAPKAKAAPKTPKAMKAPKAKAASRGRKARLPGTDLPKNPLRTDSLCFSLMDFAKKFPENLEDNLEGLKERVWELATPLKYTKLMPYWTRNGCGVKVMQDDMKTFVDVHTFTYNTSSAPRRYKLAIAVRCAELAATRKNSCFGYSSCALSDFFSHQLSFPNVRYPCWWDNEYFSILTNQTTAAEAMGIDAELEGYEKDGEEIKKLKVNGQLALFFFANEDQNDLNVEGETAD